MSGRFRFEIPLQRKPAQTPPRRSERDAQPIPKGNRFDWREQELVVGPTPRRSPVMDIILGSNPKAAPRRRAEGRQKGGENV
jgi:hypothetical protein